MTRSAGRVPSSASGQRSPPRCPSHAAQSQVASLPAVQQYLYGQVSVLRGGSLQERQQAIKAMGAAADGSCNRRGAPPAPTLRALSSIVAGALPCACWRARSGGGR